MTMNRRAFMGRSLAAVGVISFGRASEPVVLPPAVAAPATKARLSEIVYHNESAELARLRLMRGGVCVLEWLVHPQTYVAYRPLILFDTVVAETVESRDTESFQVTGGTVVYGVTSGVYRATSGTISVMWEE